MNMWIEIPGGVLIANNIAAFSKIFNRINRNDVKSVIEFGSNVGINLEAIKHLLPKLEDVSAIEINQKASEILVKENRANKVYNKSILDFIPDYKRDFVLISGVLIHINPDELQQVYSKLYETSLSYICIREYYNPSPVEVLYRGNEGKLFKRDFAGEIMDRYPDLKLIDYGFNYHRDNAFPLDDLTWFLLKK